MRSPHLLGRRTTGHMRFWTTHIYFETLKSFEQILFFNCLLSRRLWSPLQGCNALRHEILSLPCRQPIHAVLFSLDNSLIRQKSFNCMPQMFSQVETCRRLFVATFTLITMVSPPASFSTCQYIYIAIESACKKSSLLSQ